MTFGIGWRVVRRAKLTSWILMGLVHCGGRTSGADDARDAASIEDATAHDAGACMEPVMTIEQYCSEAGDAGWPCPPTWKTPEFDAWCRRFVYPNGACALGFARCPGFLQAGFFTAGCGWQWYVFDETDGRLSAAVWVESCDSLASASDTGVCIPRNFDSLVCTPIDPCPGAGLDGGSPCQPR